MRVNGRAQRTLHWDSEADAVSIIDQTLLPFEFERILLRRCEDACRAISHMQVRGAPLIGITAAYGLALAAREDAGDAAIQAASARLLATRPTAVNLRWALEQMRDCLLPLAPAQRFTAALDKAGALADADARCCESIGEQGLPLLQELWRQRRAQGAERLNILTHCNAGWLATVDWGTALAPLYKAAAAGIPIHVWVDETRPRNQGASLSAWELAQQGIAHTVIADNTGGHLMQAGRVDACLVGSDRTAANGDVCNKIGTYLKALAAQANGIPFYVALPLSTIDWTLSEGVGQIEIEERDGNELSRVRGRADDGALLELELFDADRSPALNVAFDVTPASCVSALITELGVADFGAGAGAAMARLRQECGA